MDEARPSDSKLAQRIARTVGRAQRITALERVWPKLVAVGAVLGVFLIISWLGLWPWMPDLLRFALLALLLAALLAALVWIARTPTVSHAQARRRVEQASGLQGRPLAALDDAPFDTSSRQGRALWQAHQTAMAARVESLSTGALAPRTDQVDRWALRALVALLLVVSFFVAGPQRGERVAQAFAPPQQAASVPVRIDVWGTPPSYTGLAPRTLISGASLATIFEEPLGAMLPTGTRLTLLLSDPSAITTSLVPMDGSDPIALNADPDQDGSLEAVLTGDATLTLSGRGGQIAVPLLITPDTPPLVRFAGDPEATPVGALRLNYHAEDDYGVVAAHADVEPADERLADATPLIEPPRIGLVPPSSRAGGSVETTRDLSAHPWAGLSVDMTLVVSDGAGQEATSETITTTLPVRPFREPLARALVEQRRLLAVDMRSRTRVLTALEGLAIGAEDFMDDALSDFLALTVTTQRLRLARDDDDLRGVVEMLWLLALQVEDGDLSLAAERLREAQENLSEALENDASPEELSALMDELRSAFEDYMQALAQRMPPENMAQMPHTMSMQDIDLLAMQDLMDQIENLAELGADEAARQLLDQLRQQLDQLRGAQAMQQREPSPQEQQLRQNMQELQEITREQQRLLDETFPLSSDAERQQVPGELNAPQDDGFEPGQEESAQENAKPTRQERLDALAQEQRALEEQLDALREQLETLGLDTNRLGDAGDAMDRAGDMLDRGSANNALGEQGEALQTLRDGARDMMQQLAEGQDGQGGQGAQGEAQGPGQSPGPGQGLPRLMLGPGGDGQRSTDPLGRPQRAQGAQDETVRIPEESDIQRARDILNEIQRRLGERLRPQQELDYLDRLIDRF